MNARTAIKQVLEGTTPSDVIAEGSQVFDSAKLSRLLDEFETKLHNSYEIIRTLAGKADVLKNIATRLKDDLPEAVSLVNQLDQFSDELDQLSQHLVDYNGKVHQWQKAQPDKD